MTDSPQPSAVSVTSPQIARSPLNAVLNGTNNGPSSSSTGNNSPAQLAAMLATSFREVDGLKRELSMMRRRAEKAERLLAALSTPMSATSGPGSSPSSLPTPTPLHENALKQIKQLENDKDDLEMQRDEALARLRVVSESWQELERYLSVVDLRASDARAGFSRIVADGGGQLVLAPIPVPGQYPHPLPLPRPRAPSIPHRGTVTFPQLPLPPPPNPNPNVSSSSRRPRAPSLDAAGYPAPPSKRHRSGRERARDSFIDSPMDSPRAQHPQPPPPIPGAQYPPNTAALPYAPSEAHRSQRYDSERRHRLHTHPSQQQQMPPYPGRGRSLTRSPASSRSSSKSLDEMLLETATDPSRSPTFRRPGMVGPGMLPQVQTFNTHTFAPVVTGAPVKKSKGAGLNGSGSVMTLGPNGSVISGPSGVVSGGYPPTNAAGQRICRQCGLPGRYKDGKCVEKWGPGPDGPGTVCDRCRKKMKRVERRNTAADSSQQLPVNAGPPVHHRSLGEHPSVHGSFRSPHMQPAPGSQESDRSIHRTDTLIVRHSPPPPSLGGRHLSPSGSAIQRERERDRDRDEHARPASSYVALQGSVQDRRDFGRSPQPGYSEHRDRRPKDPREIDPAGGRSHSNSLSNSVLSAIPSSTSDSPKEPVASRHSPPSEATQPVDVDADADADAEGEAEVDTGIDADGDADADADADADLLEAVDAAEANNNSSEEWLKKEDS